MAAEDRFSIRPFVNPSWGAVHRVSGRKPDGTQVRENFKDFREAVAWKQARELEAISIEQSVMLKPTRLYDEGLA